MVLSLRKEVEPQAVNKRDSLPLHSVVYEAKPEFLDSLRTNRDTVRPIEPFEPAPFSLNELEWKRYEKQRDAARAYALENDLRGTF